DLGGHCALFALFALSFPPLVLGMDGRNPGRLFAQAKMRSCCNAAAGTTPPSYPSNRAGRRFRFSGGLHPCVQREIRLLPNVMALAAIGVAQKQIRSDEQQARSGSTRKVGKEWCRESSYIGGTHESRSHRTQADSHRVLEARWALWRTNQRVL